MTIFINKDLLTGGIVFMLVEDLFPSFDHYIVLVFDIETVVASFWVEHHTGDLFIGILEVPKEAGLRTLRVAIGDVFGFLVTFASKSSRAIVANFRTTCSASYIR